MKDEHEAKREFARWYLETYDPYGFMDAMHPGECLRHAVDRMADECTVESCLGAVLEIEEENREDGIEDEDLDRIKAMLEEFVK